MKKLIIMLLAVAVVTAFAAETKDYGLEDFVLSQSRPRGLSSMQPSKHGDWYYRLVDDGTRITRTAFADTSKVETVMRNSELSGDVAGNWDGYKVSSDGRWVLLHSNETPIYRYSYRADYAVCDLSKKTVTRLSEDGGEEIATLSPDGRKVAFVKGNNVYVRLLDSGETLTVTTDGEPTKIINGVPDWVYQEEFGILNSLRWSASSNELAFLRWDESAVPMSSMELYQGDCNRNDAYAVHPGRFDYKYPVPGEQNSVVTAWRYRLDSRKLSKVDIPKTDDDYLPSLCYWGEYLMVNRLNRDQNHFNIYKTSADGTCLELYDETSDIWIDNDVVTGVKYYDKFFVVMSNRDGYNHLYKYAIADGKALGQITKGDWEVTRFYGYDAKSGNYYVQTTNGPLNRVVRRVDKKGGISMLTEAEGTSNATFSGDLRYFILNYSNSSTPNRYSVVSAPNGKHLSHLQLNTKYASRYVAPEVPKREFITCDVNGNTLNGFIVKPVDFDPAKQYPCIMYLYGGPGSQEVANRWKMGWEEYYAMQGYVIACFDGRGTGYRGKDFMKTVYLNMGKYETEDQIAVANYMASQPWIDANRIGIFGWSYGGFETLMCMSQGDKSPYAAGVAVAPVTSWRFYDTIYTERYMLTPEKNPEGYNYAPLDLYENLRGKLLLMFGSADDNVRIINSMQYIAKLNGVNRQIDMMVYPNMNHSINGCDVRLTLYQHMLDFFDRNLK